MTSTLIGSALSRGRTILLLLALILITGTVSYVTIPKEANPDIAIPLAYVNIHLEGISPEDAERMLVRPMEKELRGLDGLKEMTANAYEGGANIILEFQAGLDIDTVLPDVREQVDIAKAELPVAADEPTVNEINLALQPVIAVSLQGDIPERQLVRVARELRDEIEGISEVLEAQIAGDREEVLEIVIDPQVLDSYQLRLDEIAAAASRNNVLIAAGTMDNGGGRLAVKVPGLFESPEEFFNLPIKTVGDTVITVRDIATVRPTFKDPLTFSRVNGQPSITLFIVKRVGENVIDTIEKVRAVVGEAQKRWPEGLQVSFSQDQSDDIRLMLTDLQNNVISAVVLVMIVCIAALGWRSGVLVGIAIPGSFLAGMIVLYMLGLTVNIVVLFSLILAVGMLVDGAIVVTELADRKMNEGKSRAEAYLIASQRMAMPIISSTATTLAAFMPLLFWPGVVGEFMKYLPITLIATLSASLVMALIFVPTIGAIIGKPGPASAETMRSLAAAEGGDLGQMHGFTGSYVRFVRVALRHPLKVLLTVVVLFFMSLISYGKFGKGMEFFPNVDPEFASILVRMRGDLSVHEMDELVREVEARILEVDGFDTVTARTGISFSGDGVTEDTHGIIQLEMKEWTERRLGREILREVELRTTGLTGVSARELPDPGSEWDLGFVLEARVPMTASRLRANLDGFVERLELVRDVSEIQIRDGSQVLAPRDEYRSGWIEVFPRWSTADPDSPEAQPKVEALQTAVGEALDGIDSIDRYSFSYDADSAMARVEIFRSQPGSLEEDFRPLSLAAAAIGTLELVRGVTKVGGTEGLGVEGPYSVGEVRIQFADTIPEAERSFASVKEDLFPLIEGIPGVLVEQQAIEAGPPQGKDVQIELSSYDPVQLEQAVELVRAHLESVEGLKEVSDSRSVPGVEWQVKVDRAEASRFGADIATVGSYVQFVTNGVMLGTYRPDSADDEVDVRVRYPAEERHLSQIEALRVMTPAGLIPVRNFMSEKPALKVGKVERVDGKRVITVAANVDEHYLVDTKVKELQDWRETITLPSGIGVRFRGQDEEQAESQAFLMQAFLVALFIMGIILVTQFNSIYQALLVLVAVIFSTIGVFLGLLITGQPFGLVMNGIGVIALAGIVVNNNIVLIDTYDHLHKQGLPAFDAVLRTCAQRLRPVMLTTITTSLGLLPMVLKMNIDFRWPPEITFNAPSTQWWVQLATSVSFGLLFATVLTLVVTPALLVIGERMFGKRAVETEAA